MRLSRLLSWHARGEAAFSWHRSTGDVCEMSRDVVALCLAFADGGEVDRVCDARPGGIDPAQARSFVAILRERAILVDEEPDFAPWRPYVPKLAVFERAGDDVILYGRSGSARIPASAAFFAAANGARRLDEIAPDRAHWPILLQACEAGFAALKLLPPGRGLPRWSESTMPWPEMDPRAIASGKAARDPHDLARYHHAIADAATQFDEIETTLSHLFRAPHPSLGGETFGARLACALVERGVPARGARVVEVGGGLGFLGRALRDALAPSSYLVVDRSPALAGAQRDRGLLSVVGDALALPIADGAADLVVSNEMAGDLATVDGRNEGALALVDECARVLAPGGVAYVSEFGHPTKPPSRSDHLDHDEHSLRFADLRARAESRGLAAELAQVPSLIALDGGAPALVTTRMSFASLRSLFRAHGADLEKRAWLLDELRAHATRANVDLSTVHGIAAAPIGERTMGLIPSEFWALLARKSRT